MLFFINGLSLKVYSLYRKKYEITFQERNFFLKYNYFFALFSPQKPKINLFLARIIFVYKNLFELIKINIIRLYVIKTYKGKAHFLGKPTRGQRT